MGVDQLPRFPVKHQETRGIPPLQGLLGHQFRRQAIVKIFDQGLFCNHLSAEPSHLINLLSLTQTFPGARYGNETQIFSVPQWP